jgi:hypothetical protein
MYGHLSLQQSPPISVPARFFLTAPLFGICTALMLLLGGPELLASRWSPGMLAAVHALVLGFFATIMFGALQQILPVVAGVNINHPKRLATLVYLLWVPGIVLLIAGFWSPANRLFYSAALLIGCAIMIFATAILLSVARAANRNESVAGIRLAVLSLVITLLLGLILLLGHTGAVPLWRPELTNLHLSWGLVGWIVMLVMAVAWQVVPMFQITPAYPAWLRRSAVPYFLVLLISGSVLILIEKALELPGLKILVNALIATGLSVFALVTLRLQLSSRRMVKDNHRLFWRISMAELLLAIVLWLITTVTDNPIIELLTGAVFLFGFAMMVVTGMLIKIIAFLVWLHLQQARDRLVKQGIRPRSVPKMNAIVSSRSGTRLLLTLIVAQVTMVLAIIIPAWFSVFASLSLLVFFSILTQVLATAIIDHRRIAAKLAFSVN